MAIKRSSENKEKCRGTDEGGRWEEERSRGSTVGGLTVVAGPTVPVRVGLIVPVQIHRLQRRNIGNGVNAPVIMRMMKGVQTKTSPR